MEERNGWSGFGSKVPKSESEVPQTQVPMPSSPPGFSMLKIVVTGAILAIVKLSISGAFTMLAFRILAEQYGFLSPGLGFVNSVYLAFVVYMASGALAYQANG